MSIRARNETTANSSAASYTINVPSHNDRDILFLWIALDSTIDYHVASISGGGTWILLKKNEAYDDRYYLYYKIADSEPAAYTINMDHTTGGSLAVMSCYYGDFDVENPIQVSSGTAYRTNNDTVRAASMSVGLVDSPLLFWGGCEETGTGPTFTKPSVPSAGWTEDYDSGNTTVDFWVEICSMVWGSSGNTGSIDATASTSLITKHGFAVALNPIIAPTITTNNPSDITETTASGGAMISGGSGTVSERGLCWNTSTNPTTANSKVTSGSGRGTFAADITGLAAVTTYYVRAYAITQYGTYYGDNKSFTTDQRIFSVDSGSFTEAGSSINSAYGRKMIVESGAFLETGADALLSRIFYTLAGAFSLAGTDVTFKHSHVITNGIGEVVLSGTPAILYYQRGSSSISTGLTFTRVTHQKEIDYHIYSDIDLNFVESNKDGVVYDQEAVWQSITSLFNTGPGERIFNPEVALDLSYFLGEPIDISVAMRIFSFVTQGLANLEPRFKLQLNACNIVPDYSSLAYFLVLVGSLYGFTGRTFDYLAKLQQAGRI